MLFSYLRPFGQSILGMNAQHRPPQRQQNVMGHQVFMHQYDKVQFKIKNFLFTFSYDPMGSASFAEMRNHVPAARRHYSRNCGRGRGRPRSARGGAHFSNKRKSPPKEDKQQAFDIKK